MGQQRAFEEVGTATNDIIEILSEEKPIVEDAVVDIKPDKIAGEKGSKDSPEEESFSLVPFLRVLQYSSPIDVILRICGFFAACGAGAALPLMTVVFGNLVNEFNSWGGGGSSSSQLYDAVSRNSIYFLYLFIAKFFLVYIHTTSFTITAIRATRKFRQHFIRSLIRQDIAYFDSCSAGTVATIVSNNADIVENGLGEKVGTACQALSLLISAFTVAFIKQWKLTLVTATVLPASLITVAVTVMLDSKRTAKILNIHGKAGGLVEEALGTIRIVTAFDAGKRLQKRYDAYLNEAEKLGLTRGPVLGVQLSIQFFTMFCAYALVWFYGSKLLVRGEIHDGGNVVTVLFSVLIATTSLSSLAPAIGDFAKAAGAAKAMFEMIDRTSLIDPLRNDGEKPTTVEGLITLNKVSFAYPSRPSVEVLEDISITFEVGKTTAIVGASGSGKSTVVGLIERWYDPSSGTILLDGLDIRTLNTQWLRSKIGFVQQEPVLFSDTIYNNIAHGLYGTPMENLPESDKKELVRQACMQAYVDSFIQGLPDKYDTKVGDRGGFLSGGQKQRIAIARSIISDPSILLLDEATSALDPSAEGMVQKALENVSKSRTTIIIAHKLSTIRKADKIVVMSRGRLLEQGTHQELLEMKGNYHSLINAQNLEPDENTLNQGVGEGDSDQRLNPTSADREKIMSLNDNVLNDKDISREMSLVRCVSIILKEQKHLWPYFLGGFIATIGGGATYPAQAIVFSRSVLIFELPILEIGKRANFWALMYFTMALGVMVIYALVGFMFTVAACYACRFYRSEYFKAMLRQDVSFFDLDSHSAGTMTSRLSTDPQQLEDFMSINFGLTFIGFVNLLGSCLLAFAYGWRLALVAVFGCLPPIFTAGFMRLWFEIKGQDRKGKQYHDSARIAAEAVGAIRTVSSLTMEQKILDNYGDKLGMNSRKEHRHTLISMILFALSESLDLGASGLAFWYGGKLLSEGLYDAQTFFVVFIAVIYGGQAAGFLFAFALNTSKAHVAANQIIHLRREHAVINMSTGNRHAQESEVAIEFKDVRFSYPTRPELSVLDGMSFTVHKGESVGFVGASGCGKTTVISLLERYYDIDAGGIFIDGAPLQDLDVHFHRGRIGMVSQDTTLYQGSIKENVLLGVPEDDIPQQKLIKSCMDSNIHDFILSLPDGYETDAGSRGLGLSGGQRQRIAIARALVRNPQILLFDEATSALDTASEVVVQKALEVAAQGPGRTTITVAHRLSTVKNCDRILVLHAGRVVESGSHSELISLRGRYYEMVLAQSLDREMH